MPSQSTGLSHQKTNENRAENARFWYAILKVVYIFL